MIRFSFLAFVFSCVFAFAAAAPLAPTVLTASAVKATTFTLKWKAAAGGTGGIASYTIYSNGALAGTSTTTSFGVIGLSPTTTYSLTVTAKDSTGAVSPASAALSVTTVADTTKPSAPTNVAATAVTTTSLSLTWTASTDDVGVAGYNIYRSGVLLGAATTTAFEVTGLVSDKNNNLTVRATDAAGNLSAASPALAVRTLADPPSVPTTLSTTNLRPVSFTLRWAASAGGTGGIAAYDVYLNGVLVGSPSNRALAITGLTPTATYTMAVASRDTAGRVSALSDPFIVTTPADTTRPAAPTGLSAANVTSTSFTLTWTASTDNVGVIGYEVYRNNVLIGSTPTPTFAVADLAPSALSSMRVKAHDAAGNASAYSAILKVTTSAKPNQPPAVIVSAPADGTTFTLPITLTLTATASDSDGTIAKVEFYDGATLLGEVTTPTPANSAFYILPSTLASGVHTLTARATDNQNATTDSAPVTVALNNPNQFPVVNLTASTPGAAPAFLILTAEATDSDGTIAKVEFYEGSALLGEVLPTVDAPSTFIFPLTFYSAGTFNLTAVATDNSGAQTTSSIIAVTVNPGPATLPFVANFEPTESYVAGPLLGQLSWFSTGGVAVVPSAVPTPGHQQELSIPAAQPVELYSHSFSAEGVTPIFVDFRAQPVAGADPSSAIVFSTPAAQVALVGTTSPAELWLFGGGGRGWYGSGQTVATDASGRTTDRIRLTTREDYVTKKWDVYLNGKMVAADETFADATATSLTDFSVNGHASVASAFDEFYAGASNPLFADVNRNGLEDTWETAHGLSLLSDNRQLSPTGNGVTVLQAYLAGTDPNDFYNGTTPVISIVSGDNQSAAPGQFNAQPLVVLVTNPVGAPLANAPVTFTVTSGSGLIAINTTGTPAPAATLSLRTAADGTAQVYYQQPAVASVTSQIHVSGGTAQVSFSTTSINSSDTADADGNGLPDAWEIKYFGHVGVDPDADPDGDGLTNLQEYQNCTDPTDVFNGTPPVLTIAGGNNLYGYAGQFNPQSFLISVSSADGAPLINAPGTFAVMSGGGLLATNLDTPELTTTIPFRTDDSGMAEVYYQQPSTAGVISQISVTANSAQATFRTTSLSTNNMPSYTSDFETAETFVVGPLDGQNGWQTTYGSAQVLTDASAPSGIQMAAVGASSAIAYNMPVTLSGVSNLDFYTRPVSGTSGYSATQYIIGEVGIALILTSTGTDAEVYTCNYNSYEGAYNFVTTGVKVSIGSDGRADWHRFTFKLNYYLSSWDLYLDNALIASNCRLEGHNTDKLKVVNEGESTAYLDHVISSAVPDPNADTNQSGLPDAWQIQNFGHIDIDPNADPDKDGMTNMQEYQNGSDPNIFTNTATDSVQCLSTITTYWPSTPGPAIYPPSFSSFLSIPEQDIPNGMDLNPLYIESGGGSYATLTLSGWSDLWDGTYSANAAGSNVYWNVFLQAYQALGRGHDWLADYGYPFNGDISETNVSFQWVLWTGDIVTVTASLSNPVHSTPGPDIPGGSSVGAPTQAAPTAEIHSGFVNSTAKYQFEIPGGQQGALNWLIVFTPDDTTSSKIYTLMSWTISGALSPEFTLDPNALNPGKNGKYEIIVYQAKLAVDSNRDGVIIPDTLANSQNSAADKTSADKPFRFWVNDDDDGETTTTTTSSDKSVTTIVNESEAVPVLKADYARHQIVSKRNLEDFARLWISLPGLQDMITSGNIQIGLKWADGYTGTPAINIYPSADGTGSDNYLKDDAAATAQIAGVFNSAVTDKNNKNTVDTTGAFIFKPDYWTGLTTDNPKKCLLFEGAGIGKGQLQIVILDAAGNEIGQGPGVWMDLHSVADFYDKACATNVTSGTPPSSEHSFYNITSAASSPAPDETKQVIVFIHGINNTNDDYIASSNTMFKRLYWVGYRGRFAAFRWPCDYLPPNTVNPYHFNLSEFYAFKSANALKNYLDYLRGSMAGYAIDLYAHSQGNVVASEAVAEGAVFDNYILTQGAIPAHCYDTNAPPLQPLLDADAKSPTPFASVNGGYNGYLAGIKGNLVNFYNANDYALATGTTLGLQTNWVENQRTQKPDAFIGGPSYVYTATTQTAVAYYTFGSNYTVTDSQELKSMVARSRSAAVGAQGGLAGVINTSASVDLSAVFKFGNTRPEHSAQFTRPIQTAKSYYQQILTSFQILSP